MNDPAPLTRLDLLRFLERVQERDLARTRTWIADEERREAERLRGEQARPPVPDWIVELGIGVGQRPVEVHRGDCSAAGSRRRPVTRDEARRAIYVEEVRACLHCRPDVELGGVE